MYNATEQFAEINKAGYDNAVKLASLSLEKAERLTKLNLQAAKVALEQGVYCANAVAGIKDVQELVAVRAKLTEAGVQNALGYSRGVYQIASEAQAISRRWPSKPGRRTRRAWLPGSKRRRRMRPPVRTSP